MAFKPKDAPNVIRGAKPDTFDAAAEATMADQTRLEADPRYQDEMAARAERQERAAYERHLANQPSLSPEDSATRRRLGMILGDLIDMSESTNDPQFVDAKRKYENMRRPTPGVDSTRNRDNPQVDKFSPTRDSPFWDSLEAAEVYNDVGPGCVVVSKRNPEQYQDQFDEVRQTLNAFPEARIVTRKSDGKTHEHAGNVFVSLPAVYRDVYESIQAENRQGWEQELAEESQHGSISSNDPNYNESAAKNLAARKARVRSREMGVGSRHNSQTAGMSLKNFRAITPGESIRAMEMEARQGNRHESYEEMNERQAASRSGKKKTFGSLRGDPKYDRWERSGDKARAAAK